MMMRDKTKGRERIFFKKGKKREHVKGGKPEGNKDKCKMNTEQGRGCKSLAQSHGAEVSLKSRFKISIVNGFISDHIMNPPSLLPPFNRGDGQSHSRWVHSGNNPGVTLLSVCKS